MEQRNISTKRFLIAGLLLTALAPSAGWALSNPRLGALMPETIFPSAREYFDPLLADNTELGIGGKYLFPIGGGRFGEVSLGDYVGIFRWDTAHDTKLQMNLGGNILSRFNFATVKNSLEITDLTAALPMDLYFKSGHAVRFGYWHTSSHLGDDYILRVHPLIQKRSIDEMKAIYTFSFSDRMRVYGGGAYAFNTLGTHGPGSIQTGLELYSPFFLNHYAQWFLAQDFQSWERVQWNSAYCIRGGIRFSDEQKKYAAARVYLEYYTGHDYFLQFNEKHEDRWSLGLYFEIGNPIK